MQVSCPKCDTLTKVAGYPVWLNIVCLFFFPLFIFRGMIGRKITECHKCGHKWKV